MPFVANNLFKVPSSMSTLLQQFDSSLIIVSFYFSQAKYSFNFFNCIYYEPITKKIIDAEKKLQVNKKPYHDTNRFNYHNTRITK